MAIPKEELHGLAWAKPMTHVAKQFDVSSSYLARICALLNVSRPERGCWARLAVGRAPQDRDLRHDLAPLVQGWGASAAA